MAEPQMGGVGICVSWRCDYQPSEPFLNLFVLAFCCHHELSEAGQLHKEIDLANSFEGSWVWCQPQPSSDETLLTHITVLWGRGR